NTHIGSEIVCDHARESGPSIGSSDGLVTERSAVPRPPPRASTSGEITALCGLSTGRSSVTPSSMSSTIAVSIQNSRGANEPSPGAYGSYTRVRSSLAVSTQLINVPSLMQTTSPDELTVAPSAPDGP